MNKTDKYIDDLFHQKFSGAVGTVPPSGSDWSQLSKVIRKKNFMRFSPGSFNVYYLSAVIGTVTTVGSFVLPDIIENTKNETIIPCPVIQITDTISQKDTLPEECDSTFILKLKTVKAKCTDNRYMLQLMKDGFSKETTPQPIEGANIETTPENQVEFADSAGNFDTKKDFENIGGQDIQQIKNEVAPTDTIVKIDTLRIQKKGIQFKRKNYTF
jgi:hypothetical protein